MTSIPPSRDDLTAEVVSRYLSGDSIRTVATTLQRSYGLVQNILKEAGVQLRGPGSRRRLAVSDAAAPAAPPTASTPPVAPPPVESAAAEAPRDVAMTVHPSTGAAVPPAPKGDKKSSRTSGKKKKEAEQKMSKKKDAKQKAAKKAKKAKDAKKKSAKGKKGKKK